MFIVMVLHLIGSGPGVLTANASGVPYNKGDVFAAVGNGQIKHFSPTGTLLDTLDTTTGSLENAGMAFDLAGNLYATQFEANQVSKFDNAGNLIGPFGSGFSGNHPESIVRDAAGNFYVGQADGTRQVLSSMQAGTAWRARRPSAGERTGSTSRPTSARSFIHQKES
jgi:DNA-binding beta-propeller fold protein YncE